MSDILQIMPVTKVKRGLLDIIKTMQEEDSTIVQVQEDDSTIVMLDEQDSTIKGDYEST